MAYKWRDTIQAITFVIILQNTSLQTGHHMLPNKAVGPLCEQVTDAASRVVLMNPHFGSLATLPWFSRAPSILAAKGFHEGPVFMRVLQKFLSAHTLDACQSCVSE